MSAPRLAERAVRGLQIPPHVRIPLAMLRRLLEAEPRPWNPLADVNIRLEAIKAIQRQIELDFAMARHRYGAIVQRPMPSLCVIGSMV